MREGENGWERMGERKSERMRERKRERENRKKTGFSVWRITLPLRIVS